MRLMGECRGSIDAVKRAEGELTEDEDNLPGLTNLNGTDAQGSGQDLSLSPTSDVLHTFLFVPPPDAVVSLQVWSSAGSWSRLSPSARNTGTSRTCSSGSSWSQMFRTRGRGWGGPRLSSVGCEDSSRALTYTPYNRGSKSSRFVSCLSFG